MGFNTTVIVLNDALDQIEKDPNFGKNLSRAIMSLPIKGGSVDVHAGNHCNAAAVIESHHADYSALVLVGGNYGSVVGKSFGWSHHEKEAQLCMLKNILDDLGYRIVKKSVPKPKAARQAPKESAANLN
jgi:hypothetical protein